MSSYHINTAPVVYDIQNSTLFSHALISDCYSNIMDTVATIIMSAQYQPVILSVMGSIIVGLSGLFPLLILPVDDTISLKTGPGSKHLRLLLSFSVGGMLGDVFLHVLPEVWMASKDRHGNWIRDGWWVLAGLLVFIVVEKLFSSSNDDEIVDIKAVYTNINSVNNNHKDLKKESECDNSISGKKDHHIQISGYLNLFANCIDNFTHGLAVGGSFLISPRVGFVTTIAILVHEIPHEVGDFAILLKSGFNRWQAACAQVYTASGAIFGALTAIYFSGVTDDVEAKTSWIMPFTAGGFLHISLVTVLPELLLEENPRESIKQFTLILVGIIVMFTMSHLFE
ncbi:Zinc/iron permease [Cinara cedri]|uniref:Zinc/iron permease n=1 Tax=Cinara cedri TaxID=506608 RepID=A0A5E4N3P6_9HEMI|nr:Zinc/iron permease [Cinara cedri]